MLCAGSLLFQRTAGSRYLKNQNQRTGQFPVLQKQQKQRTVSFEYSWGFQVSADLVLRVGITKILFCWVSSAVWGLQKMGTAGYTPR